MKKKIYTTLFLLLGLMSWQHICAQESDIIYEIDFETGNAGWTAEGDQAKTLWGYANGAYAGEASTKKGPCTSYLVSPVIMLPSASCTVTFDHQGWTFNNFSDEAKFVVRTVGGEWVNIPGVYYEVGPRINSGKLSIPEEFNGKQVQFGFQYNYIKGSCMTWYIFNMKVEKAVSAGIDGVKAEDIAKAEVYDLQGRRVYNPGKGIYIVNGKKVVL